MLPLREQTCGVQTRNRPKKARGDTGAALVVNDGSSGGAVGGGGGVGTGTVAGGSVEAVVSGTGAAVTGTSTGVAAGSGAAAGSTIGTVDAGARRWSVVEVRVGFGVATVAARTVGGIREVDDTVDVVDVGSTIVVDVVVVVVPGNVDVVVVDGDDVEVAGAVEAIAGGPAGRETEVETTTVASGVGDATDVSVCAST